MDTPNKINWLAITAAVFSITGCKMENKERLEKAVADLKAEYCSDYGITGIAPSDRFGSTTIVVFCVSNTDYDRLSNRIPDLYEGFHIHFISPLWGIGELLGKTDKTSLLQSYFNIPVYNKFGTNEYQDKKKLEKEIAEEESRIWDSWKIDEKNKFVVKYISEHKFVTKSAYNCSDKFF